jgi:hypothetical protein
MARFRREMNLNQFICVSTLNTDENKITEP